MSVNIKHYISTLGHSLFLVYLFVRPDFYRWLPLLTNASIRRWKFNPLNFSLLVYKKYERKYNFFFLYPFLWRCVKTDCSWFNDELCRDVIKRNVVRSLQFIRKSSYYERSFRSVRVWPGFSVCSPIKFSNPFLPWTSCKIFKGPQSATALHWRNVAKYNGFIHAYYCVAW